MLQSLKFDGVITLKKAITAMVTKEQYDKIQKIKNKTGNSQNSIIRSALEEYFISVFFNLK